MQIPKAARKSARELFDSALGEDGRPDPTKALAVADLLIKAAPRHSVQILKEFTRLVRLETARHHAVIESATPVEETTLVSLRASLSRRDGGEVTVETKVTPSLIGGTKIRLGSEVWDATVLARLLSLKSALS
jgi:F-type H+-transporting ATPase subunit delta